MRASWTPSARIGCRRELERAERHRGARRDAVVRAAGLPGDEASAGRRRDGPGLRRGSSTCGRRSDSTWRDDRVVRVPRGARIDPLARTPARGVAVAGGSVSGFAPALARALAANAVDVARAADPRAAISARRALTALGPAPRRAPSVSAGSARRRPGGRSRRRRRGRGRSPTRPGAGRELLLEAVEGAEAAAEVVDHVHERGLARARDDGRAVGQRAVVAQDDVQHAWASVGREAVEVLDQAAHAVVAERDLALQAAVVGQVDRRGRRCRPRACRCRAAARR